MQIAAAIHTTWFRVMCTGGHPDLRRAPDDRRAHPIPATVAVRAALLVLPVLIVVVIGLVGTSTGDASSDATPTTTPSAGGGAKAGAVTIQGFAFAPPELQVAAGTKVTWTNQDSAGHRPRTRAACSTRAPTSRRAPRSATSTRRRAPSPTSAPSTRRCRAPSPSPAEGRCSPTTFLRRNRSPGRPVLSRDMSDRCVAGHP